MRYWTHARFRNRPAFVKHRDGIYSEQNTSVLHNAWHIFYTANYVGNVWGSSHHENNLYIFTLQRDLSGLSQKQEWCINVWILNKVETLISALKYIKSVTLVRINNKESCWIIHKKWWQIFFSPNLFQNLFWFV